MGFEVSSLIEGSVADVTLVGCFFQVRDLVDGQSARLAETFTAIGAFERFLFGMDVSMVSKMILPSEGFPTYVARVRSFIGMSALMNQKVVRFGKMSMAVFADELFLWTRTTMTRGFHGIHGTTQHRDP